MRIFYSAILALSFISTMALPASAEETDVVFYTLNDLGRQPEGKTSYYWYTPANSNYEEIVKDGVKVILNSPSNTSFFIYNKTDGFDLGVGWGFTISAPEGKKIVKVVLGDSRLSKKEDFNGVVTDIETWDYDKCTWTGDKKSVTFTNEKDGSLKLPANTTKVPEAIAFTVTLDDDESGDIPVLYGDANEDGLVLIDDVYAEVECILGKNPNPFSIRNADVNCDGEINVIDVSGTIDIILTQKGTSADKPAALDSLPAENGISITGDDNMLTLALDNIENITALQADVMLPDGVRVNKVSLAEGMSHAFNYALLSQNHIRFVIYSMELNQISPNQDLVNIAFDFDKSFTIGNAQVSEVYAVEEQKGLTKFQPLNIEISNPLAADVIIDDKNELFEVYTTQGELVGTSYTAEEINLLPPTVYILKSKNKSAKVIVR